MLVVLVLVAVGPVMSTLSAHCAGAVGLDQACALIIGQNIGTARRSARSTTAKRLAIAYVLFKLIGAAIALVLFPVVTPLIVRASSSVDGVTLLAGYHTTGAAALSSEKALVQLKRCAAVLGE